MKEGDINIAENEVEKQKKDETCIEGGEGLKNRRELGRRSKHIKEGRLEK